MDFDLAKTLFQLEVDQTPEDRYDEELFRMKQFFTSKSFVPKLFLKKCNDLSTFHKAAITLFPFLEGQSSQFESPILELKNKWKADFNQQQNLRSQFKLQVMKSESIHHLIQVVRTWVDIETKYVDTYSVIFEISETKGVIVSKEPNPMDILDAFNLIADDTLLFLKSNRKDLPELLQNELKRLTLLTQFLA